MLASLNRTFAFGPEDEQLSQLMKAVLIEGALVQGGRLLAGSLIKLIPGIGTAAGAAINASVAGLLTLCFGEAYMALLAELARRRAKGEPADIEELAAVFSELFKAFVKSKGRDVPRPE